MADPSIRAGAVVQLKSGGPEMSVDKVFRTAGGQIVATCRWFEYAQGSTLGDVKDADIGVDALKVVT